MPLEEFIIFQKVAQHGFSPQEQACFVATIHEDFDKVESGSE